MVSFRLPTALLVLAFAAAPVGAEGLVDAKPPVLSDLPEGPVGGPQSVPGNQPQPRMSLKRNAPPSSSARGGWYQTPPTITLKGSDPATAAPGVKPKYNLFKPDGTPMR